MNYNPDRKPGKLYRLTHWDFIRNEAGNRIICKIPALSLVLLLEIYSDSNLECYAKILWNEVVGWINLGRMDIDRLEPIPEVDYESDL